jgi:hypothetical protein
MPNNNFIDNEDQLTGQWTPLKDVPDAPKGAPALLIPHDVPQLFSGSLSPYIQHDSSFVGTQVGKTRIPSNSLMPFGPQNNPQNSAAAQTVVNESGGGGDVTKVPFSDITTGDNTGQLLRVANLSILTYYGTGTVNANEIGGINVAGNTPAHAGQVLVSNHGNLSATWQDGLQYLSVMDYGAKGNGNIAGNVSITSGTNLLNCPDAPWTAADVGKVIVVFGANTNNTDLWTTIASFTDSQNIVLTDNAVSTVDPADANIIYNGAVWGGTDDTAAINDCIATAGALGLNVYFPPGVYIYSAPLTEPVVPPPLLFASGAQNTFFVAQNPNIAPYQGFMQWTADVYPTGILNLNIIGGSFDSTVGPTAGMAEVALYTLAANINNCFVGNTVFQWGFDIQNSFATITGMYDRAQSRYQLDTTVVQGCQAAAFLAGGPFGGEGGAFVGCLAAGDWPVTYAFDFDHVSGVSNQVSFVECSSFSGNSSKWLTPRGFHVYDGIAAINCSASDHQIGFVVGRDGAIRDCYTTPNTLTISGLCTVCVSNGEIPYTYGVVRAYYKGDQIIDSNGNYQQCTVAGNSAGGTPVWPTVIGNTVVDGTVTWQRIATPAYTQIVGALVDHTNDTGSGTVYSLYDIGYRTALKSNVFIGIQSSSNPAAEVVTGHVTVTADYSTLLDDNTIYVNSAVNRTITLTTTNLLPGHKYTVKNIGTGVVTVVGQTGLIDNYSSVQIPLQYISLDFEWDGTNWWIH